jgi:hypothetical protein
MAMANTDQFLTTTSILTFGGATTAVFVISITVQRFLGRTSIVVPFVTALVVGFTVAQATDALRTPLQFLIAFANACLLFLAATGANELSAKRPAGGAKPQSRAPGAWLVSWFS